MKLRGGGRESPPLTKFGPIQKDPPSKTAKGKKIKTETKETKRKSEKMCQKAKRKRRQVPYMKKRTKTPFNRKGMKLGELYSI